MRQAIERIHRQDYRTFRIGLRNKLFCNPAQSC
jgi:hypothetical protein